MARSPTDRLAPDLATLFGGGSVATLSDGELLARFVADRGHRGEVAFAALVARHGPMVRGVCRRALGDPADADDAFQATFLILVRRAAAVRVGESLGPWLYGVSRRVAAKARSDRDRRRRHELRSREAGPEAAYREPGRTEALAALDEEVARLADPFRAAIVLCDLDGLTHDQAAVALGCPVGTVKSRLARGRARLRDRLIRRGLAGHLLVGASAPTVVPPRLLDATVRTAVGLVAMGSPIGPAAWAGWIAFKEGVFPMLGSLVVRQFVGSALLIAVGLAGLNQLEQDDPKPRPGGPSPTAAARPDGAIPPDAPPREFAKIALPDYVVEPPDIIVVEVLEGLPNRPITGERQVRPDGKISLGYYGEVYVAGLTTTEIKAKVVLHLRKFLSDSLLGLEDTKDGMVVAVAPHETSRVFVDVVSFNSKVYYVGGDVASPGRFPITGNETVLDALHYAGGIVPLRHKPTIHLVRPAKTDRDREQVMAIDLDAITQKGDSATNFQLLPGDRLIVTRDPVDQAKPEVPNETRPAPDAAERRLQELERKIELILQRLDKLEKPRDGAMPR